MNITIISPKNSFPGLPQFKRMDVSKMSFGLTPPREIRLQDYIFEFIPILGSLCRLIFGIEFLMQAAEVALRQRERLIEATGKETDLSIKDIAEALGSVKAGGFRKTGYKDAAQTALGLLVGKQNLFACRKGISLEWLFGQNAVLHAHSLTNPVQCQALLILLLYWFYRRAKLGGQPDRIEHVLVIDDASRFAGAARPQYERQGNTSVLGHLLAVLREAGIVVVFVTQLPTQIDPSALALIRNIIVVGNVNGEENLRVIKSCMSLSSEQTHDIVGFKRRETLAFISGSDWPRPIHGWTPTVELPAPCAMDYVDDYSALIELWHPLSDIPQAETPPQPESTSQGQEGAGELKYPHMTLAWDCISYPFDNVRARVKRLGFSIRTYESAKNTAVQEGFVLRSSAGKTIYLIPTEKAYESFGRPSPYKRNVSLEHSFYVELVAHTLRQDRSLTVQTETPIGSAGATIDVTAIDSGGAMTALEVTLSTSNLLSNAAKLQDTAYQKIVWLCRDSATAKAVKAYFNKTTSLPNDLKAKYEYAYVSKFVKTGRV